MKFPVKTCLSCGLDLTKAKPVKVKGPGVAPSVGACPKCSAPYFLIEDSAPLSDAPMAEPVPEKPKKGKGKTEPEPEPEPEVEPEPEPEPEPSVEPESEPEPEPEPEPES